ncbi:MAG: hypothetical protein CSA20_06100 [Deltaproteobacteria bacterium]|nr:MAG: hypothetical protein CSA20_06100 [Deltaproteobacteria bacterium]
MLPPRFSFHRPDKRDIIAPLVKLILLETDIFENYPVLAWTIDTTIAGIDRSNGLWALGLFALRGSQQAYPEFLIKLKQKGHKCYKIIVLSIR